MRHLNLDQLQTLVTIADLGSFAAASQALHLAPPTVSLHVRELEQRLGASLLDRGPRGAVPTAAGALLVDRGRRLLKDADDAEEQVRRSAHGLAGKVSLATSTGVLVYLLPHVLARLAEVAPEIDVEVSILGSIETVARLRAGTLDLGIVALPQPAEPELRMSHWRRDLMLAFIPPGWDAPEVVTPDWLAARPMVANGSSTLTQKLILGWFARAGLQPRARIELNYNEAIKSLVSAGYGAAVLPAEWVPDGAPAAGPDGMPLAHSPSNLPMQLRPLDPPLPRELALAHRPEAQLDAAVRQVLTTLRGFASAT
ncbi:LysR family transcriptional regulator [Leptothrix sp. BB-4]